MSKPLRRHLSAELQRLGLTDAEELQVRTLLERPASLPEPPSAANTRRLRPEPMPAWWWCVLAVLCFLIGGWCFLVVTLGPDLLGRMWRGGV